MGKENNNMQENTLICACNSYRGSFLFINYDSPPSNALKCINELFQASIESIGKVAYNGDSYVLSPQLEKIIQNHKMQMQNIPTVIFVWNAEQPNSKKMKNFQQTIKTCISSPEKILYLLGTEQLDERTLANFGNLLVDAFPSELHSTTLASRIWPVDRYPEAEKNEKDELLFASSGANLMSESTKYFTDENIWDIDEFEINQ